MVSSIPSNHVQRTELSFDADDLAHYIALDSNRSTYTWTMHLVLVVGNLSRLRYPDYWSTGRHPLWLVAILYDWIFGWIFYGANMPICQYALALHPARVSSRSYLSMMSDEPVVFFYCILVLLFPFPSLRSVGILGAGVGWCRHSE